MQKMYMRQRNDCLTVCLAMILGKQYEDVPLFFDTPTSTDSPNFNQRVDEFLESQGLTRTCISVTEEWVQQNQKGFVIMSGPTYSEEFKGTDVYHAVIYHNGALYHDPKENPSGVIVPEIMEIVYPKNFSTYFHK